MGTLYILEWCIGISRRLGQEACVIESQMHASGPTHTATYIYRRKQIPGTFLMDTSVWLLIFFLSFRRSLPYMSVFILCMMLTSHCSISICVAHGSWQWRIYYPSMHLHSMLVLFGVRTQDAELLHSVTCLSVCVLGWLRLLGRWAGRFGSKSGCHTSNEQYTCVCVAVNCCCHIVVSFDIMR